ncbi:MAG: MoaD/ThiS family protein [Alphaproteobacteria bacterium]|nr:MAG: MoaD/ThiS family protein [Alphaproteobacteria bacterium]
MAKLVFTSHLRAVGPTGDSHFEGSTVLEVLDKAFAEHDLLQSYILDDQRRLRKHISIFLDGVRLPAGQALASPVSNTSEIYVMQALSGG